MPKYAPIRTEGPDTTPVTLDEAKQHLRVDSSDEDVLIGLYLDAAVSNLDGESGWLNRAIVAQEWSQQFDLFERAILLGLAPITSIVSVVYLDATGAAQPVDQINYSLLNGVSAPELRFADTFAFPATHVERPVLTVTFVGGFGEAADVPAAIKVAILLMVGDMYETRKGQTDGAVVENATVRRLLDPYRRGWVA